MPEAFAQPRRCARTGNDRFIDVLRLRSVRTRRADRTYANGRHIRLSPTAMPTKRVLMPSIGITRRTVRERAEIKHQGPAHVPASATTGQTASRTGTSGHRSPAAPPDALLGQADDVALGIGDQRELRRAVRAELGHDDAAAQVLDLGQRRIDVGDPDIARSRGRSTRPACCRCRRPARSWRDRSSRSRPDCWCRAPSRTGRCSSAGAQRRPCRRSRNG